jgi:glycosyltransferase involved in cell wall biosynthesis
MRVLFFNYEYPPLGGGAGNASFYLLKEYAKIQDLEVDFVTSSFDEQYHQEKVGNNITVHRLPIGKNEQNVHFQSQADLLRYTREALKFSKQLARQNHYDLTHSFFSVPCGYLSLKLKKKFGIPYIISLRGSDVPGYSERFTLLYKFITPIIKKIWKHADFVIANSEGLKELALKSEPAHEIGVIYNGIDIYEFHPESALKDSSKFRIICVSRVTPRKGIRFLVQAFKTLSEKFSQVELVIIGDGNERKSLEDLARGLNLGEKVNFMGQVPHENLHEHYSKSDVFVLPSLNEGMSNTMLEALASGLPIVATDTGGTKELVTEGVNGFVVGMQDSKDLADKIEKLIEDNQLLNQMSLASRKRAEQLSWENVAAEYLKVYQETMNIDKMRKE